MHSGNQRTELTVDPKAAKVGGHWRRHRGWLLPLLGLIVCCVGAVICNQSLADMEQEQLRGRRRNDPELTGGQLTAVLLWLAFVAGGIVCLVLTVLMGWRVSYRSWRTHRRGGGHYTKSEVATVARNEEFDWYWNASRALARDLLEGHTPQLEVIWGVVLHEGEFIMGDAPAGYARWYSMSVSYNHAGGVFLGRPGFVAAAMIGTSIGNASLRRAAERAAATQWREHQQVRVMITNQRLLCHLADGRWVSFYYRGASAIYPEPYNWSLVMDFPDTVPLRLLGQAAAPASVAAIWATHGTQGLQNHPALESLVQKPD